MNGHVVIVGAGQAGVSVAFKLRGLGFGGSITLVGEEPDQPYHRPPLSKRYLTSAAEAQQIQLKDISLYDSERIALMLGCQVSAIHRESKTVVLADGQVLDYDHLVLATGARPRQLPPDRAGNANNVYTFRTLCDAQRLRDEMVATRKLLVIGGGYIGLETAAVARGLGMAVTLIERDSRILARVACAQTAAYIKQLHEGNGVRILSGVDVLRFDFNGARVDTVHLIDGTRIDTDVIVVGIGVVAETGLAERAGLMVNNGIVVDGSGRTNDQSIYAAGDCANFPYLDQRIRLESVQNAVDMAELVAQSIIGEATHYRPIPWFWSDQYTTKLQIAGLNLGHTHVVVRKTSDAMMSVWYYDQKRFIAVDAINDAKAFMTAKRWLASGQSPVIDDISDPAVALTAVALSDQAETLN